jgi:hypothetical protein
VLTKSARVTFMLGNIEYVNLDFAYMRIYSSYTITIQIRISGLYLIFLYSELAFAGQLIDGNHVLGLDPRTRG